MALISLLIILQFALASLNDDMLVYHYFIIPGVCFWGPGVIGLLMAWVAYRTLSARIPLAAYHGTWRRVALALAIFCTSTSLAILAISVFRTVAWMDNGFGVGAGRGAIGASWGRRGLIYWVPTTGGGGSRGLHTWPRRWPHGYTIIWWPELKTTGIRGFSVPCWIICVITALLSAWAWWRHRILPGRCPRCNYDLTGNVTGRCSECGAALAKAPS